MLLKKFETPVRMSWGTIVDVGLRDRLHDGRVDGVVDLVHRAVHRFERVVARRSRRAARDERNRQHRAARAA